MIHGSLGRAYERLPRPLRTVALNAYGVRNLRRRRRWEVVLSELRDSERWSLEAQVDFTAERLREVLAHAVEHVRRYESYRRLRDDLRSPGSSVFEMLGEFPPVSKAEILEDPSAFVSRAFDRSKLATTVTSGTTGTPFTTWLEPEALLLSDALWWRRTLWAGWKPGDWIARLVGDPVVPLREANPRRPWHVSWTDRRLYLSTYHLSRNTASELLDVLTRRNPAFLMGYPSALDALARFAIERGAGIGAWRPKAILFSSEPMYDHQREAIGAWFRASIRGLFGCAERVFSAAQCDAGSYHVGLADGYLEGQFGARVPGDRPSAARITGLANRAMPLIRFELGDDLRPQETGCPCGRTLPTIAPVVTKLEDNVVTPSGRVVSPSILTWAFKDLPGVRRSQIVQRDAHRLEILVDAPPAMRELVVVTLESRIRELVFHEMEISVTFDSDIAITRGGKTRFVVNEMAAHGIAK